MKGSDTPDAFEIPICERYFTDDKMSKVFGLMITIAIIVFNLILKQVIIQTVSWVGYSSRSEELTRITNWVFVAQFFNTGFLLLLVNANMTEHQPKFITSNLKGTFYDYEPHWYAQVGKTIV